MPQGRSCPYAEVRFFPRSDKFECMQRIEELDEEQRSVLDSNHKKIQEKETLAHADGVHVTGHS